MEAAASLVWNSLANALNDRYVLERELGRGGMATVYLARELDGGRTVAVKAMHPELGTALGAERFRREMAIAASLSHRGIVPLFDSGDTGSVLYYLMPYVQGESLHDRLEREKRVALGDALQITHDVAEALGYAHGRGILHRDVKPDNILLSREPSGDRDPTGREPAGRVRALIADFGLARAIGAADHTKLTKTGTVVGTIYYMSPEQLREDRTIDERADVYSLGGVLYEMLTGAPPFMGRSMTDLVVKILKAPVPPVASVNPAVPAAVDQAIARALAKSPAERFATMQEFAGALPRPG
jgi:eukaryotic-like serine/threonine-protein kinase